jgi:hypothetical protein
MQSIAFARAIDHLAAQIVFDRMSGSNGKTEPGWKHNGIQHKSDQSGRENRRYEITHRPFSRFVSGLGVCPCVSTTETVGKEICSGGDYRRARI